MLLCSHPSLSASSYVSDIEDLTTLEGLIASGETSFQIRQDRLEPETQIKASILQGLESGPNQPLLEPGDDDLGISL
ncbi:TPA: hypothetical protein DCE37_11500 [Candidatus Latescibacteria bacterium]|nr:hypothetical protein [Candidatus Latescibacterota bacterium]|tara:strand:+ start:843 stop:1073 length:231 start_codon:yes stop_codon:yes gene_type:complete